MMGEVAALIPRGVLPGKDQQLTRCVHSAPVPAGQDHFAGYRWHTISHAGTASMRALPFSRALVPLVLVICSAMAVSVPVHAQLGGLRRAAERRVGQKVDDQSNVAMLVEPTFDNTTIEITAARLDTYQAAMEKRKAQAAQNRAAAEALAQRANATRDSARILDKPAVRDAYERAASRYEDCRNQVQHEQDAAKVQKTRAMMAQMQVNPTAAQSDPKIKEMMALTQEMGAAQARGDTAATQRAMARLQAIFGGVTDSAGIDRSAVAKCGARPVKPAGMLAAAAMNARADTLEADGRAQSGSGVGVRGAEVGMSDVQSRMFWERIQSWLAGMRKDAPITVSFTRSEYDLLVLRRAALRKAFNGSE